MRRSLVDAAQQVRTPAWSLYAQYSPVWWRVQLVVAALGSKSCCCGSPYYFTLTRLPHVPPLQLASVQAAYEKKLLRASVHRSMALTARDRERRACVFCPSPRPLPPAHAAHCSWRTAGAAVTAPPLAVPRTLHSPAARARSS